MDGTISIGNSVTLPATFNSTTYEEALKLAKGGLKIYEEHYPALEEQIKWQKVIIKALEMLTPKKPQRYIAFDGIERNGCPTCDHNEILYAGQKYCSVCGQAIDWSEEE